MNVFEYCWMFQTFKVDNCHHFLSISSGCFKESVWTSSCDHPFTRKTWLGCLRLIKAAKSSSFFSFSRKTFTDGIWLNNSVGGWVVVSCTCIYSIHRCQHFQEMSFVSLDCFGDGPIQIFPPKRRRRRRWRLVLSCWSIQKWSLSSGNLGHSTDFTVKFQIFFQNLNL